ncbi:MAG: cell wall-active antibiotics response protein [Lachnospiraceae bacterium]|nr:cell wall-active antibiotics response protein [Lachnospiraceae bacterium]
MKNGRNFAWGIIFIVAAALVLLNGFDIALGFPVWKILITVFMVMWLLHGFGQKDWASIIFPIVFLICTWVDDMGISKGTMFFAALLGVIGMSFLTGGKGRAYKRHEMDLIEDKRREHGDDSVQDGTNDNVFSFSTSFGSGVKYVKADNFEEGRVNCSFGEVKVYFDDAQIHSDEAYIYVNNCFGNVNLYVPKEWYVTNEAGVVFGGVEEKNRSITTGSPKLRIVGSTRFGCISVTYI